MSTTSPWTTSRVREALLVHYRRPSRPDSIDLDRAARDLNVSTRTIQRWTSPSDQRTITTNQIRRRLQHLLPDEQLLRDEHTKLAQFQQGITWIKRERHRIPTMWHNRGWLEPHTLYLVHRTDSPLTGLVLSKGSTHTQTEIHRAARITAQATYQTRIHAEVAALQALATREPWRVLPPNHTIRTNRFWLNSAPGLDLPREDSDA